MEQRKEPERRTQRTPAELVCRLETDAVALTFDDCNSPKAWGRILDIVTGLSVTFFPISERAQELVELARRTVDEGHRVGSHGWDHSRFPELNDSNKAWRLQADRDLWLSLTGTSPQPYFRPPYRSFDTATRWVAAQEGYPKIALWDVDSKDWSCEDDRAVAQEVLAGVTPGSIVLLHAIDRTADALPRILDGLEERDLPLVSLPG